MGGEGFLAVCGNFASIMFTFICVVAIANLFRVGSRYIVGLYGGGNKGAASG